MFSIFLLSFLLIATLLMLSVINRVQEQRRARRFKQRRLRLRIADLEEIFACLDQTVPNRVIAKHINDQILEYTQDVLALESGDTEHIQSILQNLEARGEDLTSAREPKTTSYQRDSDLQIAQARFYINEAGKVLRQRVTQGLLAEEEFEIYREELGWAHLMIGVVSLIAQGNKAIARGDLFSAHAYYSKAQHQLMESAHPDPRRLRMIRELGEIMSGNRDAFSADLLPHEALPDSDALL
jgi:hypothetical protein